MANFFFFFFTIFLAFVTKKTLYMYIFIEIPLIFTTCLQKINNFVYAETTLPTLLEKMVVKLTSQ